VPVICVGEAYDGRARGAAVTSITIGDALESAAGAGAGCADCADARCAKIENPKHSQVHAAGLTQNEIEFFTVGNAGTSTKTTKRRSYGFMKLIVNA